MKTIPRWLEQEFKIFTVVEKYELQEHVELLRDILCVETPVVSAVPLTREDAGIGYARNYAVTHAARRGFKSFIMSDDDIKPARDSDMALLIEEAEKPGVLGVGATHRLQDHFTQGAISRNSGVIMCPGGWGMTLFALNVAKTIEIGNFDPLLDCFGEDHELLRQGIVSGIPWRVHCDVKCEFIGMRGAPGGMQSYLKDYNEEGMKQRIFNCRKLIHARWPEYTSEPEAKSRVAWQKMLDDYIPDWRSRSAMHGGSLLSGKVYWQ